jgi:ketosteroid isomerase-like protein
MKKIHSLIIVFLALTITGYSQTKEEKAVFAVLETLKKGIIDADKELLGSIAAEELVYGHSNGKVQDKAQFIDEIVNNQPDYSSIDMADQTIRISGNTAIVRHIYSAETTNNGIPGKVKIGNMLVWQKQHGKWKLLARQAYKLPI